MLLLCARPVVLTVPQIVFEAVAALVLAIVGATVRSPALREVTWRSEMKRRCASVQLFLARIIRTDRLFVLSRAVEEEEDPRMSFAAFAQRAGIVPKAPASS